MSDIIGIGSAVYDILMATESYPAEDTKIQAVKTAVQGGGPCATAIAAACRLGVDGGYMGTLGDDAYGSFLLKDFKKYGVETRNIIVKSGYVSFNSLVLLNLSNASRTCIWSKGTVPGLRPEEVDVSAIKNAKVLHLDGHQLEAAVYAAEIARANRVKVSLDAGGIYHGIEKLLPYVDFMIPSEEFALKITGAVDAEKAAAELFSLCGPEFVIITQGAKGGLIFDGRECSRYRSFPVKAVDSNGAGDVFHGAFIAGYVKGMDVKKAACFASAAAALKCTKVGSRAGTPAYGETIEFIKEMGGNGF